MFAKSHSVIKKIESFVMTQSSSASSDPTAPDYLGMPRPRHFLISLDMEFPWVTTAAFSCTFIATQPEQLMQCPSASGFSGAR